MESSTNASGLVRLVQIGEQKVLVEGEVKGVPAGMHGIHIHEYGDISSGDSSAGITHTHTFLSLLTFGEEDIGTQR